MHRGALGCVSNSLSMRVRTTDTLQEMLQRHKQHNLGFNYPYANWLNVRSEYNKKIKCLDTINSYFTQHIIREIIREQFLTLSEVKQDHVQWNPTWDLFCNNNSSTTQKSSTEVTESQMFVFNNVNYIKIKSIFNRRKTSNKKHSKKLNPWKQREDYLKASYSKVGSDSTQHKCSP